MRFKHFLVFIIFCLSCTLVGKSQDNPTIQFTVSLQEASTHTYHVSLESKDWDQDTLTLKLPKWMPGYYQIMPYAKDLENINLNGDKGELKQLNENTWQLTGVKNNPFTIEYDIHTHRQFVATSYADSVHAYIIPENTFLYFNGHLDKAVSVIINKPKAWKNIATGLHQVKETTFTAPNYDILYDCPILVGNLRSLPSFEVKGIPHYFVGYNMGTFDETRFIQNLKAVVTAASNIIGDIPYSSYTFIAIGPGRGGIEHLNNTTVSFDGNQLEKSGGMNTVMNFLAHEYFHHYNVKRIRPFELGPFDYDKDNRTNLLWVSEGLSVYYEYLIVRRAGLIPDTTLLADFERNINTLQNNPGRKHQSLVEAGYATWSDGPFGNQTDQDKTISYYNKGPVVGLLLDLAIRYATENAKSLDDVMRYLYHHFYKALGRGFTDAEFQEACETVSGTSLAPIFDYVYTTKELDYKQYLPYAGLELIQDANSGKYKLQQVNNPSDMQRSIFHSLTTGGK